MKKFIKFAMMAGIGIFALSAVFSSVAMAALPDDPFPDDFPKSPVNTKAEFLKLITLILNWVFVIFVVVAIVFVILAALQFVTGGGKAETISEARMKLVWAAVGIMVALIARGLPNVIRDLLGV